MERESLRPALLLLGMSLGAACATNASEQIDRTTRDLCNPSRTSLLSGLRPAAVDVYNGSTRPRHKIGDTLRMLPEHFHDHGYFTARVGKIAHNRFEDAVTWDVSKFALSREPEMRFHVPGDLAGVDLSVERDNTWVEGSEDGMSRAGV